MHRLACANVPNCLPLKCESVVFAQAYYLLPPPPVLSVRTDAKRWGGEVGASIPSSYTHKCIHLSQESTICCGLVIRGTFFPFCLQAPCPPLLSPISVLPTASQHRYICLVNICCTHCTPSPLGGGVVREDTNGLPCGE